MSSVIHKIRKSHLGKETIAAAEDFCFFL